jgi:hypothetical protein
VVQSDSRAHLTSCSYHNATLKQITCVTTPHNEILNFLPFNNSLHSQKDRRNVNWSLRHILTYSSNHAVTSFRWMPMVRNSRLSPCEAETYRQNGRSQVFSFSPENGSSRFPYLQDVRVFQPTAEYRSLNYHYLHGSDNLAPHISIRSKEIRCEYSQFQSQQPRKV